MINNIMVMYLAVKNNNNHLYLNVSYGQVA